MPTMEGGSVLAMILAGAMAATPPPFWEVPVCAGHARLLSAATLAVPLPPKIKLTRGGDIDFSCSTAHFRGVATTVTACWGPNYTNGDPGYLRRNSTDVLERLIRWPGMPPDNPYEFGPRDVRGIMHGKHWRFMGQIGSAIQYEGADVASAAVLDAILDQLCWLEPSRSPKGGITTR